MKRSKKIEFEIVISENPVNSDIVKMEYPPNKYPIYCYISFSKEAERAESLAKAIVYAIESKGEKLLKYYVSESNFRFAYVCYIHDEKTLKEVLVRGLKDFSNFIEIKSEKFNRFLSLENSNK